MLNGEYQKEFWNKVLQFGNELAKEIYCKVMEKGEPLPSQHNNNENKFLKLMQFF